LSSSFKGGSIYLAKFTICGFIVTAGGYEFPEGVCTLIEILPKPDSIDVTLGPLKEGTIHLVRVCSSICREAIHILHYKYHCLGIYQWINPNSKEFKVIVGVCLIVMGYIIRIIVGLVCEVISILDKFLSKIKELVGRKVGGGITRYKRYTAEGTERKRVRARIRSSIQRAMKKKGGGGPPGGGRAPGGGGGPSGPTDVLGRPGLPSLLEFIYNLQRILEDISSVLDTLPQDTPFTHTFTINIQEYNDSINGIGTYILEELNITQDFSQLIQTLSYVFNSLDVIPTGEIGVFDYTVTPENLANFRHGVNTLLDGLDRLAQVLFNYVGR